MIRGSRQLFLLAVISLGVLAAAAAGIAVNRYILSAASGREAAPPEPKIVKEDLSFRGSDKLAVEEASAVPDGFTEVAKLVDPTPASAVQSGFSVAISGNTAIVGAPGKANNRGSALIFVRNGTSWQLQQEITGADSTTDDHFGWTVAISGETAVVGTYDINEVDQGAAYVFVRNGLTWSQQQKIMPAGGVVTDQFGSSVSISGDSLIVGAFGKDNSKGAAYVYVRNGSVWTQQQLLSAADGVAADEFGWSLAISGDRVVVGAPGDDSLHGGAYIFFRNGTSWSQAAKIVASDGSTFDRFGYSTAIDGVSAMVGSPLDSDNGILSGSGYIFSEAGGTWAQQAKLLANDRAGNDKFGTSVAISGLTAIVGSNGDDVGSNLDQGSAYVFRRNGNDWAQVQKLSSSDGQAGDSFGSSVGLDLGSAIAGAYLDDIASLIDPGSAYIFNDPVLSSPTPTPGPANITVGGRVLTPSGLGLRGAQVIITDSVLGSSVAATSSSLGYFQFQVANNRAHVISVNSRRYRFSAIPITVTGDTINIEMVGLE
jgi:hypothetical protein